MNVKFRFIDINECEIPTNLCNQLCENNDGDFICQCIEGYVMGADNVTCQGIVIKTSIFVLYFCIYPYTF